MVQEVLDELSCEGRSTLLHAANEVHDVRSFAEANAPQVDGTLADGGLGEHEPRGEEDLPVRRGAVTGGAMCDCLRRMLSPSGGVGFELGQGGRDL